MHRLPFKDGSFDAVVATATLHHSPQPQVLLEEIRRVLAKGGMLVAANEPLYVPWRETPEEEKKGAHEGAYPLWGWLCYLRGSGLRLKELRVGRDASLHFTASTTAAGGVSASALAWNAASYIAVLALALPRFILRKARRIKAAWPMTKAPQGRIAYAKARLGLGGIAERALAEEDDNWGPGWYPCEEGDEPFRWCRPRARFLLPPPSGKETLVLELATFHPSPQSDPTEVEVRVGVKKAGEIFIRRHGWERLALRLTSVEGRRPTQISLRTRKGYFKPSAMGLGGDDRLLGVACRGAWWE
jgi:SAM-dependent methyltransferase